MTSTDRPLTPQAKLDHLDSELRAARYLVEAQRLDDAIYVLVNALVQIGALRSRHRMLSAPGDVEPGP